MRLQLLHWEKVSEYFANVEYNSVASNVFTEVVKVHYFSVKHLLFDFKRI